MTSRSSNVDPPVSALSPGKLQDKRLLSLPAMHTVGGSDKTVACVICQETYDIGKCSQVQSCGHCFCTECIERWADSCSKCPLCKQEMGVLGPMPAPDGDRTKHPRRKSRHLFRAVPSKDLQVENGDNMNLGAFSDSEEEDSAPFCDICGGQIGEFLLHCRTCDAVCHSWCCQQHVRLQETGEWYCTACSSARSLVVYGRPPGRASYVGRGENVSGSGTASSQPSPELQHPTSARVLTRLRRCA